MSSDQIALNVNGMSCQGCVRSVTAIISKDLGIEREQVHVDLEQKRASFPDTGAALEPLLERLEAQGFPSQRE